MDLIVTNPRALCSCLRDVSVSPAYSFDESTFGLQVTLATYARNHSHIQLLVSSVLLFNMRSAQFRIWLDTVSLLVTLLV